MNSRRQGLNIWYEKAKALGEQGLTLVREAGFARGVESALDLLGWVALAEAQVRADDGGRAAACAPDNGRSMFVRARALLGESAQICRGMEHAMDLAYVVASLSVAELGLGHVDAARGHQIEALEICAETGAFLPLMMAIPAAALLLAQEGQHELAVEYYAVASQIAFVSCSPWFDTVFGRAVSAAYASLPPQTAAEAHRRGERSELQPSDRELVVLLADLNLSLLNGREGAVATGTTN